MTESQIYNLRQILSSIHLQELNQKLQIKKENMTANSIKKLISKTPENMPRKYQSDLWATENYIYSIHLLHDQKIVKTILNPCNN